MGNNFGKSYNKGKLLGKGNFASVFQCNRKSDGKPFAVKIFTKKNLENEEDFRKILLEM